MQAWGMDTSAGNAEPERWTLVINCHQGGSREPDSQLDDKIAFLSCLFPEVCVQIKYIIHNCVLHLHWPKTIAFCSSTTKQIYRKRKFELKDCWAPSYTRTSFRKFWPLLCRYVISCYQLIGCGTLIPFHWPCALTSNQLEQGEGNRQGLDSTK